MANVQGTFYTSETQRRGVTPVSPPNSVDDPKDPVSPSSPVSFISLIDTPSSYLGQTLKGVRVNAGETGLEFYTITSGGGTPAGANTEIQYNNAGIFGASSDFIFNNTSKKLTVGNSTSLSTSTPVEFNLGGTFADSITSSKAKWKLYDDGVPTNIFGIGMSLAQFNFFKAASGGYYWYFNNIEKMRLNDGQLSLISGTLVGFNGTATVTSSNYAMTATASLTVLNVATAGEVNIRINNINAYRVQPTAHTFNCGLNQRFRFTDGGEVSVSVNALLGFVGTSTVTTSNYALSGNSTLTLLNVASGGSIQLRAANTTVISIASAGTTFTDATNIAFGTITGTKIGSLNNQKIAFWGKTPIIQPTTGITGATRVGGGGTTITDTDTFGGYTIAKAIAALINTGILA